MTETSKKQSDSLPSLSLSDAQVFDRGINPLYQLPELYIPGTRNWYNGESRSSPCGDFVAVYALVIDGKIIEMRHQCQACCLTKAAADVVCEWAIDKDIGVLKGFLMGIPEIPTMRVDCINVVRRAARELWQKVS